MLLSRILALIGCMCLLGLAMVTTASSSSSSQCVSQSEAQILTTVDAIRQFAGEDAVEGFQFSHLLLHHRQQSWTLARLLEQFESFDLSPSDLAAAFDFFTRSLSAHSGVEEEVLFPYIQDAWKLEMFSKQSTDAQEVIKQLLDQHQQVHPLAEEIERNLKAMEAAHQAGNEAAEGEARVKVHAQLQPLVLAYHKHYTFEEKALIPVLQALPLSVQQKTAKAAGLFFKNYEKQDIKFLLPALRDVAVIAPEDEALWATAFSWFVRNIIVRGLSWTGSSREYYRLFGAPGSFEEMHDLVARTTFGPHLCAAGGTGDAAAASGGAGAQSKQDL